MYAVDTDVRLLELRRVPELGAKSGTVAKWRPVKRNPIYDALGPDKSQDKQLFRGFMH